MSKEWSTAVAEAEAAAERTQSAEDEAHRRFDALRTQIEAAGRSEDPTGTEEFRQWMHLRRQTDDAWGAWAMAMDSKPS